jgi:hypothetical protein
VKEFSMKLEHTAVALTALNLAVLLMALTHGRPAVVQDPAPVVRARALELVDDKDVLRARLNVENDGQVVFRLLDRKGTIRVKLGAGEDGSGLLLNNQATEPGIHLLANSSGSTVRLANPGGKELVLKP